jgi:hypothetical protein
MACAEMPRIRSGMESSQTMGARMSASNAMGQQRTNRMHHPMNRISAFIDPLPFIAEDWAVSRASFLRLDHRAHLTLAPERGDSCPAETSIISISTGSSHTHADRNVRAPRKR